jgi:hypothetical protein
METTQQNPDEEIVISHLGMTDFSKDLSERIKAAREASRLKEIARVASTQTKPVKIIKPTKAQLAKADLKVKEPICYGKTEPLVVKAVGVRKEKKAQTWFPKPAQNPLYATDLHAAYTKGKLAHKLKILNLSTVTDEVLIDALTSEKMSLREMALASKNISSKALESALDYYMDGKVSDRMLLLKHARCSDKMLLACMKGKSITETRYVTQVMAMKSLPKKL